MIYDDVTMSDEQMAAGVRLLKTMQPAVNGDQVLYAKREDVTALYALLLTLEAALDDARQAQQKREARRALLATRKD